MASTATRLWRYLPGFLKRRTDGELKKVVDAVGTTADVAHDDIKLLPARAAANRFDGEFATYYGSETRQDDVARIAQGRMLAKLRNESWEEFEERLRAFFGLETWDGTMQQYSRVGDVAQWGCMTGLEREIERTGLVVSSIYGALEDPYRWIVRTVEGMGGARDTDFSMIVAIDGFVPDPDQRRTRIYSVLSGVWTIWIVITNPNVVTYTDNEVLDIVRLVKPAWVRAYVGLPDSETWQLVE